mgnify:CR=1 FL=1
MSESWVNLKPGSEYFSIFPDGKVNVVSPVPIFPREVGSPECYEVDPAYLTEAQKRQLAEKLLTAWGHECSGLEEAIAYINENGLSLKTEHFAGFTTTDPGIFFSLMDSFGFESAEEDWASEFLPDDEEVLEELDADGY